MDKLVEFVRDMFSWLFTNAVNWFTEDFTGADWYKNITDIVGGTFTVIASTLAICCFLVGLIYASADTLQMRRSETVIKMFFRIGIVWYVINNTATIVAGIFNIVANTIRDLGGASAIKKIDISLALTAGKKTFQNFWDWVTNLGYGILCLLCILVFCVLIVLLLIQVFGRLLKLAVYTVIAPIPFATFASRQTERVGVGFLKSYIGVCVEGLVMYIIFLTGATLMLNGTGLNMFPQTATTVAAINKLSKSEAAEWLCKYFANMDINMLVTCGLIKGTSVMVREWMSG